MKRAPVVVGGCFTLLYWVTRTYDYTYDGLRYAIDVRSGDFAELFHPNHVLYSFLNRGFYNLWSLIGSASEAIHLLQNINALIAGIALGVFFWMLDRDFGWKRAFVGTMVLGLSQVFWMEAVDPGCYAWTMLAFCVFFAMLARANKYTGWELGGVHGLAVLFHQMMVLAVPAVLLLLPRRKWGRYFFSVIVISLGVYAAIALHQGETLYERAKWVLAPAGWGKDSISFFYWWSFDWKNILTLWQTFVHAFVAVPASGSKIGNLLEHVAVAGLSTFCVIHAVRYFRKHPLCENFLAALWLWIPCMLLFQGFHLPSVLRFRLFILPVCIYLFWAHTQKIKGRWRLPMAFLAVAVMAGVNYTALIGPQSVRANSFNLVRSEWVASVLKEDDVYIYSGGGPDSIINMYMVYFSPSIKSRSLRGYFSQYEDGDMTKLNELVTTARKNRQRIFFEKRLFDADMQADLETQAELPKGHLAHWLGHFKKKKEWNGPGNYRVLEVR